MPSEVVYKPMNPITKKSFADIKTEFLPYPDGAVNYASYFKKLIGIKDYELKAQTPFYATSSYTFTGASGGLITSQAEMTDKKFYCKEIYFSANVTDSHVLLLKRKTSGKKVATFILPVGISSHSIRVTTPLLFDTGGFFFDLDGTTSTAGDIFAWNIYGWFE